LEERLRAADSNSVHLPNNTTGFSATRVYDSLLQLLEQKWFLGLLVIVVPMLFWLLLRGTTSGNID
jgi:hypothetical protein